MLVFFHRLCPAVLALDMQATFGVSGTLLGVLGSAYFYPYAVMQLPSGLLADSWGPRKTVSLSFLMAAAGAVLMGLSPVVALAIMGRIMVGFGVSTLFVSNFKLLAEWFEPREYVIIGGVFMAMGGIGALSSTVPLAWVSDLLGWRLTFVGIGLLTVGLAVAIFTLVRDRPEEKGWPALAQPLVSTQVHALSLWQGLRVVLTARSCWPLFVWGFCATGVYFAFMGLWGGPYLMQVHGMTKAAAGGVLSMAAVSLIIGGPMLSLISNSVGRKPVFIGAGIVLVGIFVIFYLFVAELPGWLLYLLFFGVGLSGAMGALQATASKELFPIAIAGTAVGVVNFFPFVGGAFFQVLFGSVLESGESAGGVYSIAAYHRMFFVCMMIVFIALIAAFRVHETLGQLGGDRREE
jgi:sugar phosphate permease